jgi:hypothetical protein
MIQSLPEICARPWSDALAAFTRAYDERMLRRCRGNVSEAAAAAGLERTAYHHRVRRFGLDPAAFRLAVAPAKRKRMTPLAPRRDTGRARAARARLIAELSQGTRRAAP